MVLLQLPRVKLDKGDLIYRDVTRKGKRTLLIVLGFTFS